MRVTIRIIIILLWSVLINKSREPTSVQTGRESRWWWWSTWTSWTASGLDQASSARIPPGVRPIPRRVVDQLTRDVIDYAAAELVSVLPPSPESGSRQTHATSGAPSACIGHAAVATTTTRLQPASATNNRYYINIVIIIIILYYLILVFTLLS